MDSTVESWYINLASLPKNSQEYYSFLKVDLKRSNHVRIYFPNLLSVWPSLPIPHPPANLTQIGKFDMHKGLIPVQFYVVPWGILHYGVSWGCVPVLGSIWIENSAIRIYFYWKISIIGVYIHLEFSGVGVYCYTQNSGNTPL